MGSGDLPGLQSRRFFPSRVEWWIRLPHASANRLSPQLLSGEFKYRTVCKYRLECYVFNRIALGLRNRVRVNAKRRRIVAVPHLLLKNWYGCIAVSEFGCKPVTKRVEPHIFRGQPQFLEHGFQTHTNNVVARAWTGTVAGGEQVPGGVRLLWSRSSCTYSKPRIISTLEYSRTEFRAVLPRHRWTDVQVANRVRCVRLAGF